MLRSAASIDRRDLAALVGAAVCWGSGTVVSKAALAEIAPVTLLAIQLASSLMGGFDVSGFWPAFFGAIVLAIVNAVLRSLVLGD